MEPKTGRKIVSKGEYVRVQGERVTVGMIGICLWLVAIGSALLTALLLVGLLFCLLNVMRLGLLTIAICLACLGFIGYGTYIVGRMARECTKSALENSDVVPFTRANTAHLPAPDSLVRAASEPEQAQQAVLLRAAAEDMERHAEQLVRAVNGQEKT